MSEVQTSTGGGPARRTGTGAYGKRPAPEPRVLVVGHLSEDRTPRDRTPERPRLGGAAAYAGLLLHRWGARTEILTAADPAFPFLEALAGIRLTRLDSPTRTVFGNRYRADGSREQYLLGRATPLPEEAVAQAVAALPPGSAVLYAPIADELPGLGPLPRPAGAGSFAGAIPQGFLRRADPVSGRVTLAAPAGLSRRLSGLDLVCLGDEEARVAGIRSVPIGTATGDPAGDDLAAGRGARRPLLAITGGAAGAVLLDPSSPDPEDRPTVVPAFPAKTVDPTGAGDVFAAALLFGLWRGEAPAPSARLAAAAAALTVEAPGVAGIPGRSEAAARWFSDRGTGSRRTRFVRD